MAPPFKFALILVNLALLQLVLSARASDMQQENVTAAVNTLGSAAALEHINSLDYAPSPAPIASQNSNRQQQASGRRRSKKETFGAKLALQLLNQLEALDLSRLLAQWTGQLVEPTKRASDSSQKQRGAKTNASALTAETGQLLSITKQLVKLARNQMLGQEHPFSSGWPHGGAFSFGGPGGSGNSAGSMLSAASHALQDSLELASHHHLSKSDWLWWAAPAVIVLGTGVIVVPLVAAWLVSQAMSQNTFTVSAGRRRRRRHANASSDFQYDGLLPAASLKQLLANIKLQPAPN